MSKGRRMHFFGLLLVMCYVLFVFSCQDPFSLDDNNLPYIPAGKGAFSLSLGAGRTLLPAAPSLSNFAVYNLDFTPVLGNGLAENVDRTNQTLATVPILLEPGTYNLVVNAYRDPAKNQLMARGVLDGIVIIGGKKTACAVTLEALLFSGTGTFIWDITLPADVTASMKISPVNVNGTSEETVDLIQSGTSGSRTLNSEAYNLTFNLKRNSDGKTVVWDELLYVYQNLESKIKIEFTDAHFSNAIYTITFVYNNGDDNGSRTVLHGGTVNSGTPNLDSYIFVGWYTDNNTFLNEWSLSTAITRDITLYAKWRFDLYTAVLPYSTKTDDMTIYVPHSITLDAGALTIPANTAGKTLTITSADPANPCVISRGYSVTVSAESKGLFTLPSNARLIFKDIIVDGDKTTYGSNIEPLVRIEGGTLTMEDNTVLRNNRATSGGAVHVSSGTFTMNGGDITGNTATNRGGGVFVESTFNMTGGRIYGNNSTSTSSSGGGGGVFAYFGTFNMTGGDIYENTVGSSSGYGGGVNNYYSRFILSEGNIYNNSAANGGGVYNYSGSTGSNYIFNMSGGTIRDNNATNGGGVYNDGTFTMTNGEVTGNIATNGGGVYNSNEFASNYAFTMTGGEISGNTAATNGGGVYNDGIFTVGGSSLVKDNIKSDSSLNNVYIVGYKFLTLGTGSNAPVGSMEIFINAAGTAGIVILNNAKNTDVQYFDTDDPLQEVKFHIDGHLYIDDLTLSTIQLDFYMRVAAYAGADNDVIITLANDLTLPIPVVVPANAEGKTLTVKGNAANRTLTRGFSDTESTSGLFIVGSNAKLTFEDLIIDGDKTTYSSNTTPLVRVSGGTLTMGNNAVLQNNRSSSGGAVSVSSGTFNMNNGEITANTATSRGGGVYIDGGTFNMNGGKIYENNHTSTSSGGGGVCVYIGGTFNMSNGEITNNTARNGGGVYNYWTSSMSGGTISGNTATANGGGVYNDTGSSKFTMTGGEISGNTAATNGGGVFNYYSYSSTSNSVSNSTTTLGGTAKIRQNTKTGDSSPNNVYLPNTDPAHPAVYIVLGEGTSAPTTGMEIYVNSTATPQTIIDSGATAAISAYFKADDTTKSVVVSGARLVLQ